MSWRVACSVGGFLLTLWLAGCGRPASTESPAAATQRVQPSEEFLGLMNAGKNYQDQGDATNALAMYLKAGAIIPNDPDLRLNLANCYLLNNEAEKAAREADEVLKLEPNSAVAYFVKGSAFLRLGRMEEAAKALENVKRIDPGDTATFFQLGTARMGLQQWDEAIKAFQEGIAMDPNRLHTAAHYRLSQSLMRVGRQKEAEQELIQHQAGSDAVGGNGAGGGVFERSKHTQARVPFKLEQPEKDGIQVRWVDATQEVFGDGASEIVGPIGVVDVNRSGWNSLFVLQKDRGFRLLRNREGHFRPEGTNFPANPGAHYTRMLVGDLLNHRADEVTILGDKGSHVFQVATNGVVKDVSSVSRLNTVSATDGLLIDLDFTGKLDLVAISTPGNELRLFRQYGPLLFTDITSTSGVPATLKSARQLAMEDWNRDGVLDLIVSRGEGTPLLLEKQRGGKLIPREMPAWVPGSVFAAGDFDNDLRPDLAVVGRDKITLCFSGGERQEFAVAGTAGIRELMAIDYDNDGWLDLCGLGDGVRFWRNRGLAGFIEQTRELGLEGLAGKAISEVHFADYDKDCDVDAMVVLAEGGVRYLRNEGANTNALVKVNLVGNRSNSSGLGSKIEIVSGGLRLIRTVKQLPVEVGVGKAQFLDSFLVHWFNWPQGSAQVPFTCNEPLLALELTIQEGSCPYLYAWNGDRYEFITDILGASPLGLPLAEGRYIESDPEEFVWIGTESTFPPKDGLYRVQITEELREVLYLDEAKLVVVDRPAGVEVHPLDKLLPGKPYPPGGIATVGKEQALVRAETLEGLDVTDALRRVDGRRVSPPKMRVPQLRGLAEPHGVVLDFGPLDTRRPWMLAMNGWLRFGGGMANVAASHDASLPFPFPVLEAEVEPGKWKPLDVSVGAPAGKTKTILVDLEGKLEPGSRRLRLSQAFEIHWDRIALLEKQPDISTRVTWVSPTLADLHFRGFSALRKLPMDWPLTPEYRDVSPNFYWTITPGGYCTRYGDVSELVAARDEGLLLLNGGDELSLGFPVEALPPKPPGTVREFFLYTDGWDKDSDFHVATGTTVEPLPFHGMNDQEYGRQARPAFRSDALNRQYNTRWVEGRVLKQISRK